MRKVAIGEIWIRGRLTRFIDSAATQLRARSAHRVLGAPQPPWYGVFSHQLVRIKLYNNSSRGTFWINNESSGGTLNWINNDSSRGTLNRINNDVFFVRLNEWLRLEIWHSCFRVCRLLSGRRGAAQLSVNQSEAFSTRVLFLILTNNKNTYSK